MKKLLIEVVSGVMDNTAYVYDGDGNKIVYAHGSDNYEAIRNVCLKLTDEIIDIKTNKKKIEFFKNVSIGTKLKYKLYGHYKYGYYAGVIEDEGLVIVSRIPKDDEFTGLKITSYEICEKIDAKLVKLYEEE